MVSTEVRTETGAFAGWAECRDQAKVAEQPKGLVDRLRPLVAKLDTCTPTRLLEANHPALDSALVGLHRPSPKQERLAISA